MAAPAGVNQYLNNHYDGMTPEQLILMLYKGALDRLQLAKQGVEEKNIQKRGENVGRVIAIVSELNSSLDPTMTDDSTEFLRGLYTAILTELPRVSVTNDITILQRTEKYLSRLKEIWEGDVMGSGKTAQKKAKPEAKAPKAPGGYGRTTPVQKRGNGSGGYGHYGTKSSLGSIAV